MRSSSALIPADFFSADAVTVARQLIGCVISHNGCSGIIVETEAYKDDDASHARQRTARSELMHSTHGHWYVYLVYGMYYCLNITTNGNNQPGAVLIRAVEPLDGIELMKKRRGTDDVYNLLSGPGKVCQAFGIDDSLNGQAVNTTVFVYHGKKLLVGVSGRVGIRKAAELPWRFFVKGNAFVSR